MTKIVLTAILLTVLLPLSVWSQSSDDPEVQKAKEETVVVFDLARFFGFLKTMEEEKKAPELSQEQLEEIYEAMIWLQSRERVEAADAEEVLIRLEDEVLTPDQLMEVDQLALAREEARAVRTPGGGEGGLITSYIAGGAFNPIASTEKTMGKDFAAYLELVRKRVGK